MKICSFNVGMGPVDLGARDRFYHWVPTQADAQNPVSAPFNKDKTGTPIQYPVSAARYDEHEERMVAKIKGLADVYCLQETRHTNRLLIAELKKSHAFFARPLQGAKLRSIDNMLLIKKNSYTSLHNFSKDILISSSTEGKKEHTKDVAIVIGTKADLSKEVFVSLHAPGFGYHLKGQELEDEKKKGDIYCQKVFQELEELEIKHGGFSRVIIGGDFNADPEIHSKRFEQFPGFRVVRTGQPTAIYAKNGDCSSREIDFFLVRDKQETVVTATALETLNMHRDSISDHTPILLETAQKIIREQVRAQTKSVHHATQTKTASKSEKTSSFLKSKLKKARNWIRKILSFLIPSCFKRKTTTRVKSDLQNLVLQHKPI